jgi:nucleotide-binding universal stress UspA family protein
MKTILVPVDGSVGANRAVQFAARLARDTGAALTLLHVYDAPTASQMGLARQSGDDFKRAMEELGAASFGAADKALANQDVKVEREVVMGHPAAEIVAKAQTMKADLVVMGSRGRTELESVLLGSVSERVVRQAPCPVTIVR